VQVSRPLRARGLKHNIPLAVNFNAMSRPLRARGLKRDYDHIYQYCRYVAPPAGAWIETLKMALVKLPVSVAPPAGAWIETHQCYIRKDE